MSEQQDQPNVDEDHEISARSDEEPIQEWELPSLVAGADIDEIDPAERTATLPESSDYTYRVAQLIIEGRLDDLDPTSALARELVNLARSEINAENNPSETPPTSIKE